MQCTVCSTTIRPRPPNYASQLPIHGLIPNPSQVPPTVKIAWPDMLLSLVGLDRTTLAGMFCLAMSRIELGMPQRWLETLAHDSRSEQE